MFRNWILYIISFQEQTLLYFIYIKLVSVLFDREAKKHFITCFFAFSLLLVDSSTFAYIGIWSNTTFAYNCWFRSYHQLWLMVSWNHVTIILDSWQHYHGLLVPSSWTHVTISLDTLYHNLGTCYCHKTNLVTPSD